MAIEEYFEGTFSHPLMDEDQSSPKKWKSVSACAAASEDSNGCFECNICLDHARDPVVTLCGHLYCWPCIYKWLHFQTTSVPSNERHQHQQCPVCKADVSSSTLVPLYGRGHSSPETKPDGKTSSSTEIPQRPPAHGVHGMVTHQLQSQFEADEHQQYHPPNHNNYAAAASSPIFSLGGTTTHPMVWMFGEMVCTRMFGNSTTEVGLYGYRNSYHRMGSSPRVRRQEMKAEKSLNRISIFLFCCLVLCLLLF